MPEKLRFQGLLTDFAFQFGYPPLRRRQLPGRVSWRLPGRRRHASARPTNRRRRLARATLTAQGFRTTGPKGVTPLV
ncbi:MAG: hypothetical protein MI920_18920 [Kiloniellales bacterium]|nr:hypothetical protein [Kiloniellales bacterium]